MADDLLTQFRGMGVKAEAAVPAWTGIKPYFGGYGNWNFLFTQWRAVALSAGQIGVWSTWTGVPGRRMHLAQKDDLQVVGRGRRYDRFRLGDYGFWVTHEDGDVLMEWIATRST